MFQLSLDFLGRQMDRLRTPTQPKPPQATQAPRPVRLAKTDRAFVWKHGITIHLVHRPRARRYLLSVMPDGSARLVIPRRGSEAEGIRFLERAESWLLKRLANGKSRAATREPWQDGARFLFRGEETALRVEHVHGKTILSFADQTLALKSPLSDYRDVVFAHLRRLAERELPPRTRELALAHGIDVRRVTVRAQKTRWGSCSARGTISLNWRLIQAPPFVVDYLIIHELMHRREMNHSARYWKHVAQAFPDYKRAEQWLKKGGLDLRA
jgi:predicted metal-dependent hydrolase